MSILFLILLCIQLGIGQGKKCSEIDTNLCYVKDKYPASLFSIEKKYESVDTIQVVQTPLLADVDNDCIPEILTVKYGGLGILIIDSKSGLLKRQINTPSIDLFLNGLAVADIDLDGIPEIFFETSEYNNPLNFRRRLMSYTVDGLFKWISDQRVDNYIQFQDQFGGTPALADFNQDGIPEIYVNNKIFNAQTGKLILDGGVNGLGCKQILNFRVEALSIAAQLDDDSKDLELAAGFTIYKVRIQNTNAQLGNSMTPINIKVDNSYIDGFTTIGDINLDGKLDVVVTSPGINGMSVVYAYTLETGIPKLISKAYPPGNGFEGIGPACIGSIDGSQGQAILFSRFGMILSYSYDGTSRFKLNWLYPTTDSSASTSITMFDFNGDNINEIVYRDESALHIINGNNTPVEIGNFKCLSTTLYENAIVGDIDNSGTSKICVTCGLANDRAEGYLSIFSSSDRFPGWAPARGIWNQYNYHVLNINDDLTVPRVQKNNATYKNGKYNNFYVQESLLDSSGFFNKLAASLTGKIKSVNYNSNNDVYIVTFDIYNRSDASTRADSNLAVSFYNGDPVTTGTLIGIYHTSKKIDAGDSLLNLQYTFAASNLSDLFMVINTTRNKSGAFDPIDFIISECDYTDNTFRTLVFPKDERVNPCKFIDTNLCYIKEKFPVSVLKIEKKIESDELIYGTYTPLLADVDGDCVPELITPDINNQNILIINTKLGNTKYRIATFALYPFSNNFCIGDIDGDGTPEIFVVASPYSQNPVNIQGKLICYNLKGDVIWISDQRVDLNYIGNLTRIFGVPGLADFNQDGIPEIYISNKIFNSQTGVKLADGGPNGIGSEINPSYFSPLSIAAQLDEDFSDLELAAGYSVYKVIISNISGMAGNNMIAMNIKINNELRDGTTTISDINLDGRLDVVVTSPGVSNEGLVYVYTLSNSIPKLIAKAYPPGGSETVIGSPLIGDIKGFGKPSIIFSRVSKIYSYSYNGSGFLQQDWSQTTTDTSGVMGITMFDLNNDGVQELIYRDMNSLNIVDGSSIPVIIASINCFSPTWYESPIVGDLDNTGHAKICVPCSFDIYNTDGKLTIFGPPDSIRRWAPARTIWNQYNYHVLNINDDLTVPRVQKNNATYKNGKYNNFYVQESLLDSNGFFNKPAASLTGKIKSVNYNSNNDIYTVTFDIYNRADASARADSNLAVSFYNGDPATNGTLIGIYQTLKKIDSGDSLLNLQYTFSASNLSDLFMVINTTRNKTGAFDPIDFIFSECDYTDNTFRTLVLPKDERVNPCKSIDTNLCYIKEKFPVSELKIELKIESEDGVSLSRTSLLADIDGDCIPELIIGGIENNQLNFINPFNGKTIKKINSDYFGESASPFAIADVDNDGKIEIVLSMYDGIFTSPSVKGKLVCLNLDGTTKWISDQKYGQNISFSKSGCPAFADFNQDGKTEVYIHNSIFNGQTGAMLCNGSLNGIGNQTGVDPTGIGSSSEGTLSVAAQLDDDPADLELAAGYSVYKVMISNPSSQLGNKMTPLNILIDSEYRDGLTSVADINQDGKLDVIVSSAQKNIGTLYVYSMIKGLPTLLTKKSYSNNISNIGPALIGDINGTGQLSIIIDRPDSLFSFNYDGTTMLNQQWSTKVNDKSGDSHLTLFDLDNDGKNEIIYRDESFLRILNSASNFSNELAKIKCPAPSRHEGPIVGDIDNSGNVKICVSCFNIDSTLMKLYIFAPPDTLPGWAPGRGIWNQYAYNPLFINDDLTVPQFQKNQATYKNGKYNNFMQQESYVDSNGMVRKAAASLTGQIKCINYDPLTNEYKVVFDLYNRKDASNQADSNLAVSFYNDDPTSSGTLIGIYYTLKSILAGDSLLNLQYRFAASNLKDLFMVVNTIRNGSGVFDEKDFTQSECDYTDNISRTLELPKLDSIQAKICKGASFQFLDTTIQDPGMYYRKLSTINGCDSLIYILNLSTVDTIYIKQSVEACDVYSWNNKLITQSGIYVFDTLNQFGCDSLISLDLIINKSSVNKTQHTACDSYTWNGQTYDKSGFYTFQTMNQAGCDSTINLELIIHKSDTTNLTIETCDSYVWNGRTYTQSGIYTLDTMNQNGCDSNLTLDLSINSIIQISTSQSTCDSLTWNGITYTQSGIYKDTTQSSKGCDSITTLQLTISKSNQSLTTHTSCDSYVWNGTTYTKSGMYTFATQNATGCDSIATLQLTINPSTNSTTNMTVCDSLLWNNIIYKQSGTYQYTSLNAFGCDSIATLKLIINPSYQIHIQQTACNSYTWNGKTYNQSGSYLYQIINSTGCDSITTLDLNIIPSSTKDTSITICDSITFLNKTLNTKGNYTFTLQNTLGCDSVINLNLNINSQHYRSNVSTCGSYQWSVNGITYDSSGMYVTKYTNRSACDSTYQLDLTIHKNYEIKEKAEVCKEYLWPVNKVLYTQSGEYIYPLKTNYGCDSIIKLNLLVNSEFQHADTVTTTDAYTWPINQKTYPTSGTYKEIYTTKEGCDSIHLLLLSINKDVSIYYPNIIHPGGLNSFFTIYVYGASATIKTLSIYDRWGERIWQKQNFPPNELQQGWDGKYKDQDVMPGVYVWHAEIVLKDGSVIKEKGDVTVVH